MRGGRLLTIDSEEEWNHFGKKLSSYVKIFEDNGLTLGYHNHAFEFNKLPSGKMPIECILDHNENLKFEIDLGWTVAGKQDPLIWIKKYANKIIACHLKDFFSKDKESVSDDHDWVVNENCSQGLRFDYVRQMVRGLPQKFWMKLSSVE